MPARAIDPATYYRTLFEVCGVAYIVGDDQGRVIECNPATAALFACEVSDMIGSRLIDWSPPQQPDGRPSSEHVRAMIARVSAGEVIQSEWQCIRQDGRIINIAISVCQVEIAGHCHHLVTHTDITEYKRSEQERDKAWALLQAAIEQSPSGILIADAPDVRIRFANSAALTMRGHTQKLLTDIDVSQHSINWQPFYLDGSPYPAEKLPLSRAVLHGETTHGEELIIRDESGEDHWVIANASPVLRNDQVVAGIVIFHDISVQKAHERQLQRLAHFDPLTGLPNRTLLADRLRQAMAQARRNQQRMALVMLDLDGFKWINDTLGHEAGDELLCMLAQRLISSLRDEDTVARQGGDEFVVIAQEVRDTDHVRHIVNKLLTSIQQPMLLQGQTYRISGSAGIALYPDDGLDAQLLIRNADIAMYQAKAAGKNCSAFYAQDMQTTAMQRLALEDALRQALARGLDEEIELCYQPIVATVDERPCCHEVLLRWQHPQQGLIAPAELLAVAENSGLIMSIGAWAMRAALQQLHERPPALANVQRLAFKLSPRLCREPGLVPLITRLLAETQQTAACLTLEISEAVLLYEQPMITENLEALQHLGVQLALTGFGSGYSSLTLLQRLPINYLKIDAQLIQQCPQQAPARQLVQAIIQLAHGLQHPVVADGVETQAQADFLRELACDYQQGPYHGPAQPLA